MLVKDFMNVIKVENLQLDFTIENNTGLRNLERMFENNKLYFVSQDYKYDDCGKLQAEIKISEKEVMKYEVISVTGLYLDFLDVTIKEKEHRKTANSDLVFEIVDEW